METAVAEAVKDEYERCVRAGRERMAFGLFRDCLHAMLIAERQGDGSFEKCLSDVVEIVETARRLDWPSEEPEGGFNDDDDYFDCDYDEMLKELKRVVRSSSRKPEWWIHQMQRLSDNEKQAIFGKRAVSGR